MKKLILASWLLAGLTVGLCQAAIVENPEADPRLHPGEVRVLKVDNTNLKAVIPDSLFMKHWFGTNMSVAYFRFLEGQGNKETSQPALHLHGTELGVQLKGNSEIIDEYGRSYTVKEGDVFIIKGGVKHTGKFGDGENVILGIVTPPRAEYGPEEEKAYFPGYSDEVSK